MGNRVLTCLEIDKWYNAESALGLFLFNVSTSELEERVESILLKFTDDTKWGPSDAFESQGTF